MKRKNVLRELLREGKPTIGTHLHCIYPVLAETAGYSGTMDYVEFSGEYAPYDLFSLDNFGRAIDLFDHMTAMIKLDQEPRTYLATRAVGAGIPNLLFADIRTVEDAKESVAAARAESPETKGIAGVAVRRDVGYGFLMGPGSPEYVQWLEDVVVALMIEKGSAVENLEEILSVEGVDMVQFGPADYAMSIGLAGQRGHAKIKEAERYVIETCLKMGIRPRAEIRDFEQAKPYIEMGVKDFCIGRDISAFYDYLKRQGEDLAKLLGR